MAELSQDAKDAIEQEFQKEREINANPNASTYHKGRFEGLTKQTGRHQPPKAPEGKGKPEDKPKPKE